VSHLPIESKQKMEENDPSVLYRYVPSQHTLLQADLWGQPGNVAWSFSPDAQDSGHVRCAFNGVLEGASKTQGLLLYSQGSRSETQAQSG
jgi:hypothetical protein